MGDNKLGQYVSFSEQDLACTKTIFPVFEKYAPCLAVLLAYVIIILHAGHCAQAEAFLAAHLIGAFVPTKGDSRSKTNHNVAHHSCLAQYTLSDHTETCIWLRKYPGKQTSASIHTHLLLACDASYGNSRWRIHM